MPRVLRLSFCRAASVRVSSGRRRFFWVTTCHLSCWDNQMGFDEQFGRSQAALHSMAEGEVVIVPDPQQSGKQANPARVRNAIVGDETEREEDTDRGLVKVRRREVAIITDRAREGFCGVVNLGDSWTVEVGDLVYSIDTIASSDTGSTVLHLTRTGRKEITRRGFNQ